MAAMNKRRRDGEPDALADVQSRVRPVRLVANSVLEDLGRLTENGPEENCVRLPRLLLPLLLLPMELLFGGRELHAKAEANI